MPSQCRGTAKLLAQDTLVQHDTKLGLTYYQANPVRRVNIGCIGQDYAVVAVQMILPGSFGQVISRNEQTANACQLLLSRRSFFVFF
jgi:hypothetical protein